MQRREPIPSACCEDTSLIMPHKNPISVRLPSLTLFKFKQERKCIRPGCGVVIEDMDALVTAHAEHMTPHHKRTHKGGRAPAADPRDNPEYTPTQARRIMKNRLSAARSKLRKKAATQV